MPAWLRFGWVVVALGVLGSRSEAGSYSRGYDAWGWTGWTFFRDPTVTPGQPTPAPLASHSILTPMPVVTYSGPVLNSTGSTVVYSAPPIIPPFVPSAPAVPGGPVYTLPSWFMPASSDGSGTAAGGSAPAASDPASVATPAAQLLAAAPAPAAPAVPAANAYINLGAGPFKDAGTITSGNADAWFHSTNPQVLSLFGGTPTAQQQVDFSSTVMQRVEQTFQLAHVPVTLTTDPGVPAAHTLSLVSNTSAQLLQSAIGMTYVGGNGFGFLDQQAQGAQTLDQLEWIAAHNLSHELMLALGVREKFDTTGQYLDARNALWAMMTNPNATFSPDAITALNSALTQPANTTGQDAAAQVLASHPVPEPTAVALWTLGALALTLRCRPRKSD